MRENRNVITGISFLLAAMENGLGYYTRWILKGQNGLGRREQILENVSFVNMTTVQSVALTLLCQPYG